ncbi:MAG: lysophospholipid acyltransferase family protein [Thermodesulfobacteriota bacterium]
MINRIISVGFLVFIALSSILFFLIALTLRLLTGFFDRRLVLLHYFTCFWASVYTWIMPAWSVSIHDRRHIRKGVTYMVVSNHQSQLDILLAFRLFFPFKWVSKAEVFKVPLIGWNMVLNRYIKLKRGDKDSIRQMMDQCEETLSNGSSVYFFPEGTRSETGVLKPFKPGAFILAKKLQVPILPIVINGSKNALPKHSLNFHGKHHMHITVLEEIPPATFAELPVEEIIRMVREKIAACLGGDRESAGHPS